jgi:hypothetical protein
MKDRMLKLGFAALVALAIPTVAVLAHGAADQGLSAAGHAQGNVPDGVGTGTPDDPGAPATTSNAADRPHNHGWFVSQAAKDHSTTGKAHGAAVSKIARGDQGKPAAASH